MTTPTQAQVVAATIERCAQVAEKLSYHLESGMVIAAAIRKLKDGTDPFDDGGSAEPDPADEYARAFDNKCR